MIEPIRGVKFISTFQAARFWSGKGFEILPIRRMGNVPVTEHGLNDATSDIKILSSWFTKSAIKDIPDVNLATVPAEGSSLFDVDVDMHGTDGISSWRKITEGRHVPRTLTEVTQSGGLHLTFLGEYPVKSRIGVLPGIDIIGQKHYAIRAPSAREKGGYRVYDWKIASAPAWLLELIEEEKSDVVSAQFQYRESGEIDAEHVIGVLLPDWKRAPAGHSFRFRMAAAVAGYLLRKNIPREDIKFIISELGRRTGHADHSRVVDYTFARLSGERKRTTTGAPELDRIREEVEQCLAE